MTTIIIATEMAVVKGAGLSQNTRVRKAAELPMTLAQRLRSKQISNRLDLLEHLNDEINVTQETNRCL